MKKQKDILLDELEVFLKKSREERAYISIDDIVKLLKVVFDKEEIKIIKEEL